MRHCVAAPRKSLIFDRCAPFLSPLSPDLCLICFASDLRPPALPPALRLSGANATNSAGVSTSGTDTATVYISSPSLAVAWDPPPYAYPQLTHSLVLAPGGDGLRATRVPGTNTGALVRGMSPGVCYSAALEVATSPDLVALGNATHIVSDTSAPFVGVVQLLANTTARLGGISAGWALAAAGERVRVRWEGLADAEAPVAGLDVRVRRMREESDAAAADAVVMEGRCAGACVSAFGTMWEWELGDDANSSYLPPGVYYAELEVCRGVVGPPADVAAGGFRV